MKKLFLLFLLPISVNTFTYLRFNKKTKRYYCENPEYKIDQKEYNQLVRSWIKMCENKLTDHQIYCALRVKGSDEALQLIKDIQSLVQDASYDVAQQHSY